MRPTGCVRPLEKNDVPRVAELHSRVFVGSEASLAGTLTDHLTEIFYRHPCQVDDLPSLGLGVSFERLPEGVLPEIERRLGERLEAHVESIGERLAADSIANGPTVLRVTTYAIEPPTLPWQRVFEIAITPRIETATAPKAHRA